MELTRDNLAADELRSVEQLSLPDVRLLSTPLSTQENMHAVISEYELNSKVPKEIKIQFDTARNLYLYAFHVYRFYMVAQQHLYGVLEFAIRECIGEAELERYFKVRRKAGIKCSKGLSLYLRYLKEYQLIQNQDFHRWHTRKDRARWEQYDIEVSRIMDEQGLDEYHFNQELFDSIDVGEVEWDIVSTIIHYLPKFRNDLAHGSQNLTNDVLIYFEDITTIINKMYERQNCSNAHTKL